jgi:hypothetical protein
MDRSHTADRVCYAVIEQSLTCGEPIIEAITSTHSKQSASLLANQNLQAPSKRTVNRETHTSDLGGRGVYKALSIQDLLLSSNRDSQPLPGGKDLCGCGGGVGLSWGSNPGTAPPVIKDLLDRPWDTLAVIAA